MFAIAICLVVSVTLSGCDEEIFGGGQVGNSRENPMSVTIGYLSSHNIRADSEHWFRFVGTGEPIIFETRGNVVSTSIAVFEGNHTVTWAVDNGSGEGYNGLVSMNTVQGTEYFIRVQPRNGTSGSYTFVVTAPFFNT